MFKIFNGYKFVKDKKTGYYLSGNINGKRYRLHRYIWEFYNGTIPKGYDIHHIDHNKDNNNIDNLELLSKEEHIEKHKILSEEIKQKYRENLILNARPKATEWHKSNDGREWHKKQYKNSLGMLEKKEFICKNCGNHYFKRDNGNNKFCSNKCRAQFRRNSGIDNEIRKCLKCNNEYEVNKYSYRKYCFNCGGVQDTN